MIPHDLPNPFHGTGSVKDTHTVPPGHVPELHAPVLATIHRAMAGCRASGSPTSVLVRGETGSGKTHLLAQLRDEHKADPATLVVGLSFFGAYPGGLWRHVRKALVTELLRPTPGATANGLTRILHARYPQWGSVKGGGGSILDLILPPQPAPKLATFLAQEADLPIAVRSVLARLYDQHPETAAAAAAWLRGDLLGDASLISLGLPVTSPTDRESEGEARDVVLSVCRLAGEKITLVLGFDNIETAQSTLVDEKALRDLAWLIGELATGDGARVVVTFVRPETVVGLRKAADKAAMQRIAAEEAEIPWLGTWEHVVRLVAAQLETSPPWQALRRQHPDPYWPFDEPFLRQLLTTHKFALTPRHLMGACRVQLEQLRKGNLGSAGPAPKPRKPGKGDEPVRPQGPSFDGPWQKRRDKYVAQPASLTFDTVIGLGLPWLRELVDAPYAPFEHPVDSLPDVNVLFRPAAGGRLLGVSCCDHNPAQLWRRLDRLTKQWAGRAADGTLGSLILMRQAKARLTPVAEGRLAALKAAGVGVLLLPREQYAELAAYQQIFANVQAGNYTDIGRPVTVGEFATWAKGHLSSSVKELADVVFGHALGRKPSKKRPSAVPT